MAFVIPTIYLAIDKMSGVAAKIGAANTAMGLSVSTGAAQMERSFTAVSNSAMKIGTTTAAMGLAILVPLGLATHAAMDFEKQMGNVATLVDTSTESIAAMGDQLLNISKRVPVAISDLTESLYQIRSAGIEASDAMNVLDVSARLSVAGLSSATDATKAVTSAMVSFKQQGLTAEQIANSFFLTVKEGKTKMEGLNESFGNNAPLVASAGVKLQEFNALTAAMTNAGMSASEAQNAIRMSVLGLIKPTTEMNTIFRRLGVTTGEQLIDKMGGLDAALDAVKQSAVGTNIEMAHLFNRTGLTAFTVLTGQLSDAAKKNIQEQMQGQNALNEAFAKQAGTTASKWQTMKNNVVILGIKIGTILLPAVITLTQAFIALITPLVSFAKHHKTLAKVILVTAGAIGVLSLATSVLAFSFGGISKLVSVMISIFPSFAAVIYGIDYAVIATTGSWAALLGEIGLVIASLYVFSKIANKIDDTEFGMKMNYFMGDQGSMNNLKQSLERKYINDPVATRQFIADNPKFNSPLLQQSFSNIDNGIGNDDDADELMNEKISKAFMIQGKGGGVSTKTIMHDFTITLKDANGKGIQTVKRSDLMPSVSPTSNYSGDDE